jgi:drug/metabolite transporter (DMT)-like permease
LNSKQKSYIALATICIVWGITWVVSKHAIVYGNFPPLQLSGIRQTIAGGIFCIYFLIKGYGFPKVKDWKTLIVLSILMFALSNGLSTVAVTSVGSGLGSVIGAITALWLALFGYFVLKQKVNRNTIIGLIFGFAGILIIFYDKLDAFANKDFTIGIIISILATVTWALGTIYTVKTSVKGNAWYNTGWQMLISGVILTALSYTQHRVPFSDIKMVGWLDLSILVIGGSLLTFVCYMYLLQKLPAAQVSIYVYINPIIAVLLSHWVFINDAKYYEPLTATLGIGAAITLLGVYLVNNSMKIKE